MNMMMPSFVKSRARRAGALALVTALATLPFGSGCGRVQDDNSSAFLIVGSLEAASGATPGTLSGVLASDVQTKGGIFEDPGSVHFVLGLKNSTITAPTSANFITVTGYHVVFARADGGPVPAAFDGALTVTVNDTGATGGFVLVPASAKTVAPLNSLVGTLTEIQTIATVTFFGKDQAGHAVQATATISVNFADWGDPA